VIQPCFDFPRQRTGIGIEELLTSHGIENLPYPCGIGTNEVQPAYLSRFDDRISQSFRTAWDHHQRVGGVFCQKLLRSDGIETVFDLNLNSDFPLKKNRRVRGRFKAMYSFLSQKEDFFDL